MRSLLTYVVVGVLLLLPAVTMRAQGVDATQITGFVRDSLTREPLGAVTIALLGTTDIEISNAHGGFNINYPKPVERVRFSSVGYRSKEVVLQPGQSVLVVDMVHTGVTLGEVTVRRKKPKYSKKNNPALDMARTLIASRDSANPTKQAPFYRYDKYERMMFGINDIEGLVNRNKKTYSRFGFLLQYADTSSESGKRLLPISVKELRATDYYRLHPQTHREYVHAYTSTGFDESFDQASVKRFLDDVFREVDIFGNDVTLLTNRFVSPLSTLAPNYYKFYLTDTVTIAGERCAELSCIPFNTESFGFLGRLYVSLADSLRPSVRRVVLGVPNHINLNYVQGLHIVQDFEHTPDGLRHKVRDNIEVDFQIIGGTPGLFARRETSYRDFSTASPAPLSDGTNPFDLRAEQSFAPHAEQSPDRFAAAVTTSGGLTDGNTMANLMTRLRSNKKFYWFEKTVVALTSGYVPTAKQSKWDFGPLNSIFSGNTLEGLRLRLGGMTTVNLSRHWFTRAYVAYGFRDKRLKYMGRLEYSFNEKKHVDGEFPVHSLRLTHRYDVDRIGQRYLYTNADNVFLALKRRRDDKIAYLRSTELTYTHEWQRGFSIALTAQHHVHEASRLLPLTWADGSTRRSYTEAGFSATLRYAPGEKVYQTRSFRIPINMDAPVFTLTHTYYPKGFLGSLYTINKTEVGFRKRFWFSAFGYIDLLIKGAKLWNPVPYPDLLLPNANLSYTIQDESYTLLNPLEFAHDQSVSWDFTYWLNGLLLNRVPLIKRLKLREVVSLRGFYGGLGWRYDPRSGADNLPLLPDGALCAHMGSTPYLELGIGLDNILTVLRIDYVRRLTYRHTPGTDRDGVRVQLHFTF